MGEVTTYAYDAEDHVTDVIVDPNGLKLHSSYTYDLIGEIASSVPPNGNVLRGATRTILERHGPETLLLPRSL